MSPVTKRNFKIIKFNIIGIFNAIENILFFFVYHFEKKKL